MLQAYAEDSAHVLEASSLEAAAAGTFTDGQEVKVDDYFTLYMSAKTKIVVLRMREVVYTAIFAALGICLIILLIFMFMKGKKPGMYNMDDLIG